MTTQSFFLPCIRLMVRKNVSNLFHFRAAATATAGAANTAAIPVDHGHDDSHGIHSVSAYEQQWTLFFKQAPDLFELQRGLNNCFAYDIVPTVPIVKEALFAARRLNDFATAVRVFAGLRDKVDKPEQYDMYVSALQDIRAELGIPTPEELQV